MRLSRWRMDGDGRTILSETDIKMTLHSLELSVFHVLLEISKLLDRRLEDAASELRKAIVVVEPPPTRGTTRW